MTKKRFTAFIHAHKSKILPLLGDEKVADLLEEEYNDEDVHQYEEINDQPAGYVSNDEFETLTSVLTIEQNQSEAETASA